MDAFCIKTSRIGGDVMSIILGLDMSSHKSGYALFNNDKLLDYGLWEITSDEEQDWRKRIAYMADCVGKYCDEHKVDKIYAEDVPPIVQNSQTVKVLSALQGMLIAVAVQSHVKIEFIPVKTWKQKVGINLTSSHEYNVVKQNFKDYYGNKANRYIEKLKNTTKAYEKKMSIDYVNQTFGLNLIYKSPSSKKNQDDIADAICIGYFYLCESPYCIKSFSEITNEIYNNIIK